jgi:hypothetical protein
LERYETQQYSHQIAKTIDNIKLRATNFSILLYLPLRPSCKI